MASVYWFPVVYIFTEGLDSLAQKSTDTRFKFNTVNYLKNSPNKQNFNHLRLACFAYPVKLYQSYAGHWLDRALWLEVMTLQVAPAP